MSLPILHRMSVRVIAGSVILLVVLLCTYLYITISYTDEQMTLQIRDSANRVSDIIKQSTRYSMLLNRNEDVYQIITTVGREPGVEGIRIYNKRGEIIFSTDERERNTIVDMRTEACYVCHAQEKPLESLSSTNRVRVYQGPAGYRVLGVINPIRNEAACSDGECHAHPAGRSVLGVLDVRTAGAIGYIELTYALDTKAQYGRVRNKAGKDLLASLHSGKPIPSLTEIVRRLPFFPETMPLDVLLREFQKNRTHVAMVVDEYGTVSGMVTFENVLEQVVGPIQDEFDRELPMIIRRSGGRFLVDALCGLDDRPDAEVACGLRNARMRHEHWRLLEEANTLAADQRRKIMQPLAARDRDRIDRALPPFIEQKRRIDCRNAAPVAFRVLDVRATCGQRRGNQFAAADAAKNHDPLPVHIPKRRQFQQRLAVEPFRREHIVDTEARQRAANTAGARYSSAECGRASL